METLRAFSFATCGAYRMTAGNGNSMGPGRPTEYKPEFCNLVVEWGAQGKSLTWMAAELDVSRECVYNWARVHPSFSDALDRARAKAQQWWEDQGQNGMVAPMFNGGVWAKNMASRFPDDWRDNKGVELTGAGGGPVKHEVSMTPEEAYKRMIGG